MSDGTPLATSAFPMSWKVDVVREEEQVAIRCAYTMFLILVCGAHSFRLAIAYSGLVANTHVTSPTSAAPRLARRYTFSAIVGSLRPDDSLFTGTTRAFPTRRTVSRVAAHRTRTVLERAFVPCDSARKGRCCLEPSSGDGVRSRGQGLHHDDSNDNDEYYHNRHDGDPDAEG